MDDMDSRPTVRGADDARCHGRRFAFADTYFAAK